MYLYIHIFIAYLYIFCLFSLYVFIFKCNITSQYAKKTKHLVKDFCEKSLLFDHECCSISEFTAHVFTFSQLLIGKSPHFESMGLVNL